MQDSLGDILFFFYIYQPCSNIGASNLWIPYFSLSIYDVSKRRMLYLGGVGKDRNLPGRITRLPFRRLKLGQFFLFI